MAKRVLGRTAIYPFLIPSYLQGNMQPGDPEHGSLGDTGVGQTPSPLFMSLAEPQFPQICNGDSAWHVTSVSKRAGIREGGRERGREKKRGGGEEEGKRLPLNGPPFTVSAVEEAVLSAETIYTLSEASSLTCPSLPEAALKL